MELKFEWDEEKDGNLLFVVFTKQGENIQLISSRLATERLLQISRNTLQKPAGRGDLHGLPAALEECLESLSILLHNQAAKPKRHRQLAEPGRIGAASRPVPQP